MSADTDRLAEIVREAEQITTRIRSSVRSACGAYESNPTPWESQSERSAHWIRDWVPTDELCPSVVRGNGSGEGHPDRPGFVACTRLRGHRDIRSGDGREHLYGPERYSEARAIGAARRIASENRRAFEAITTEATR